MAVPVIGNKKYDSLKYDASDLSLSLPDSKPSRIDMRSPEARFIEQLLYNLANPVFQEGTPDHVRQIHQAHKPTIDVGSVPNNSDTKGRVIRRGDPDYYPQVGFVGDALEAAYPVKRAPAPQIKAATVRPKVVRLPVPGQGLPTADAA
jgi:hypothetical protein